MSSPLFAIGRQSAAGAAANDADWAILPEKRVFRRDREAAALLLIASAVFLALALASFSKDPANLDAHGADWVGPAGRSIASLLVSGIGIVACAAPIELLLMALPLFRDRPSVASIARIGGDIIVIFILCALTHVSMPNTRAFGAMPAAGIIGELFGEIMRSLFSTAGSYIIGITAVGLILIARASFSFISLARKAGEGTGLAAGKAADGMRALRDAWTSARKIERTRADEARAVDQTIHIDTSGADQAILAAIDDDVACACRDAEVASKARLAQDAVPFLRSRGADPVCGSYGCSARHQSNIDTAITRDAEHGGRCR